jgi:hypothetical protein
VFIDRIGAGDYESGLKTGRKLVVPCGKCSSVQYRLRNRMHGSLNSQLRSRLVSEVFVRHNKAHFKSTKHSPHPSRACPTLTRSRKSAHEDVLTYIVRYNIRIRTVVSGYCVVNSSTVPEFITCIGPKNRRASEFQKLSSCPAAPH